MLFCVVSVWLRFDYRFIIGLSVLYRFDFQKFAQFYIMPYLCTVKQTNDVFPALGVENDLTAIFDKDELIFFSIIVMYV